MPFQSTWTSDRVERLKALWADGHSARDIAAELGFKSPGGIIGKKMRLNLPDPVSKRSVFRNSKSSPRGSYKPKPAVRVTRVNGNSNHTRVTPAFEIEQHKLRCVEIIPRNLALMDLERGDCRYPYGHGPFLFCGHPKREGSPYCTPHHFLSIGPGTKGEQLAARVTTRHLGEVA